MAGPPRQVFAVLVMQNFHPCRDCCLQRLGASSDAASKEIRTIPSTSEFTSSMLGHTSIELSGPDRPGLLYELSAAIASMGCSVLSAEVWTNNGHAALVMFVTEASGLPLKDPLVCYAVQERLREVMQRGVVVDGKAPVAQVSDESVHPGRRMHQLMFADKDFEESSWPASPLRSSLSATFALKPIISVGNSDETGYTTINITCADRPKLLFDTVCTLTDMSYTIHHAKIDSEDGVATQVSYWVYWFIELLPVLLRAVFLPRKWGAVAFTLTLHLDCDYPRNFLFEILRVECLKQRSGTLSQHAFRLQFSDIVQW